MKRIPALLLSLLCLALSSGASAAGQTANVAWVLPVTYSDNSALPLSDIAFVTIQWTLGGVPQTQKVSTAPLTSAVVNVPCGSVTFDVLVTTTSTAKYPNATSGPSNSVPYATGIQCVPNPASGVTAS